MNISVCQIFPVNDDFPHPRIRQPNRAGTFQPNERLINEIFFSQEQLKAFERDYDVIIRRDCDEITYQIEKFLDEQNQSYKKIRQLMSKSHQHSSTSEDESDSSSSNSENPRSIPTPKRFKSHRH